MIDDNSIGLNAKIRKEVTIQKRLMDALKEKAHELGISANAWISTAIAEKLKRGD